MWFRALFSDVPRFFIVTAIGLNLLYLAVFSPLQQQYFHAAQRFFYIAHLAESALGDSENLPESMLELLARMAPGHMHDVMATQCRKWEPSLRDKYCTRKGPPKPFAQLISVPLEPQTTFAYQAHRDAALFPILGYLPYIPGAWIALLLHFPPLVVLYCALITNALVVIPLGYYTLKLLPVLRWPVCYLLLLPSTAMTRIFIMPDGLTTELCCFALALALQLKASPRAISALRQCGLVILAGMIGLVKTAYFPAVVSYALIPASCFGSQVKKWRMVVISVVFAFACSAAWGIHAVEDFYPSGQKGSAALGEQGILTPKIEYLVWHPITFLQTMFAPFMDAGMLATRLKSFLTWDIYWAKGPVLGLFLMLPLLLSSAFATQAERKILGLKRLERTLAVAICIAGLGMLYLVRFFQLPIPLLESGEYKIGAVQSHVTGRYYIPLVPFLCLGLYAVIPVKKELEKWLQPGLIAFLIGCLVYLHYGQIYYAAQYKFIK